MARLFQKGVKALVLNGRRKGESVEVTEVVDDHFIKAKGPKGKVRKYNTRHLQPA